MNSQLRTQFLAELSALTFKYHIAIGGLGVGSPFLFYPMYCLETDKYVYDENNMGLVWTGDTIKPRTELKVIKKKSKKASRIVDINPEAVNFGE